MRDRAALSAPAVWLGGEARGIRRASSSTKGGCVHSRMIGIALVGLAALVSRPRSPAAAREATDGRIVACQKNGGFLRIVENASGCRATERVVTWNMRGPAGETAPGSGRAARPSGSGRRSGPAGPRGSTRPTRGEHGQEGQRGRRACRASTARQDRKGRRALPVPPGPAGASLRRSPRSRALPARGRTTRPARSRFTTRGQRRRDPLRRGQPPPRLRLHRPRRPRRTS